MRRVRTSTGNYPLMERHRLVVISDWEPYPSGSDLYEDTNDIRLGTFKENLDTGLVECEGLLATPQPEGFVTVEYHPPMPTDYLTWPEVYRGLINEQGFPFISSPQPSDRRARMPHSARLAAMATKERPSLEALVYGQPTDSISVDKHIALMGLLKNL